jgi:5-methylcytosine-specific restriction endonuclease McrA
MPSGVYIRKPNFRDNCRKAFSNRIITKTKEEISEIAKRNALCRKVSNKGMKYNISDESHKKMSEYKKGKPLCLKHRENISKANRGSNSYSWKGGVTKLNRLIRFSFEYRQWRSDVFTRDNFICQWCDSKGYLEAHHLKALWQIIEENNIQNIDQAFACEELWNINNGITLCEECHNKTKPGRI